MDGKLRNMTAIYLSRNGKLLMLYRVGSRVVLPSWCGIGGHFEKDELNDAKAAMLREMSEEIGISEHISKILNSNILLCVLKTEKSGRIIIFLRILKMMRCSKVPATRAALSGSAMMTCSKRRCLSPQNTCLSTI